MDDVSALSFLDDRFDDLLRRYGGALRRVASSYEADASRREDLFQDICLALWKALPKFRGDSSERTWLFRIAHNRGLSHGWRRGRSRRSEEPEPPTFDQVADRGPGPESVAMGRDRARRLRAAVRALPNGSRQVVALSLEGLPQREIGDILGISENNVAVRLSRARATLRKQLERDES